MRPVMWRVPLLLFLALTTLACSDQADERILSWHSHLVVEKGGDLLVTETITVRAEGNRIKRGIYRAIPLLLDDKFGPLRRALGLPLPKPFKVVSGPIAELS